MGEFLEKYAENKMVIAIISFVLGAMLLPLLKWFAKKIWDRAVNLVNKLSRNRQFLKAYLNWTINTNKFISVLPSALAAARSDTLHLMELDKIYISLIMSRREDAGSSFSLEEAMENHNKIIILGDPGAGKSTMMQYLTLHSSHRYLGKKNQLRSTLPKRLPILIRLNKFHDIKVWETGKDLLAAIIGEIKANLGQTVPENFLDNLLKAGNCLILFDAFDELASAEARRLLSEKVKNFAAQYPDNQFIVTSRITGYNNQLATAGFSCPHTIQKLTSEHISTFVRNWYENLARLQGVDKQPEEQDNINKQFCERAEKLIPVILGNNRIRQLAINPMLLSLIALVHYIKVRLPDQRHVLYRECLEILVEQWDSIRDVKFSILDQLRVEEKKRILQRIAWHMQENHLKSIAKNELIDAVLTSACREISGEKIQDDQVEKFLSLIEERTGLISEKGFNEHGQVELSFSHLTLQEYLASLEMLSLYEKDDAVFAQILDRLDKDADWWQEVALLALSQFKNTLSYQKELHKMIMQDQ